MTEAHLVFVVGPTACGKSDFAVEASEARARAGHRAPEIINCDSIQFYEGLDIGAAKPSAELLKRAHHHLIGHIEKGKVQTAGDFRRAALAFLESSSCEEFLVVGGSGFYVQALEKGMYDVPEIPEHIRSNVEKDLAEKGLAALHDELKKRDPEAARKIQPADRYRTLRSLEILRFESSGQNHGQTLSEIRARFEKTRAPAPFRVSKIGIFLPRDILRARVTLRTQNMLRNGLIEEVEFLRSKGLNDWPPLSSVGYKEVQDFLDGRLPRPELEQQIITSTMQLAKRQMTWFKRDPEIRWFDSQQGWREPVQFAQTCLEK
jgi:tRNA dimethylallyltransferase